MKLSEWLKRGGSVAAVLLAVGLIAADPLPIQAQGTAAAPSIEELLREIEQLQRRVETFKLQLAAIAAEPPAPAEPAASAKIAAIEVTKEEVDRTLLRELKQLRRRVETFERQVAAIAAEPPAPAEPAAPGEIGAIEVTKEEVARALDRALVQTGALLLPAGTAEIEPSFAYIRQEADALVSSGEDGTEIATNEIGGDNLVAGVTLRIGLPLDSQLEFSIPYQYEDESTVTRVGFEARREEARGRSGFGDIGVTFAKTLLLERGWRPDLIARVDWDTNTGETSDGVPLGSGFNEIRGSLTATKSQEPLVFVFGASYETSFEEGGVDPGDAIGFSIGTLLAASPTTSLRFFLNQSFVDELEVDSREIPGTDQVVGTFVVGASSLLSPRVLLDVTAGIGLTKDASDYFVSVSLPVQFDLPFR